MNRALLIACAIGALPLAYAGERRLTLSEAEQLAPAALMTDPAGLPSFSLEPPFLPPRKGAMFNIIPVNAQGNVHVRALLVDIDTAEVWDPGPCEPLAAPTIGVVQRRLRRQIGISSNEVNHARIVTREHGCSSLVDESPRRSNFDRWRLKSAGTSENRTFYRYLFILEDLSYIGVSPVPIKIQEGRDVEFYRTSDGMYVIDDDGTVQELFNQSEPDLAPPPPKKK